MRYIRIFEIFYAQNISSCTLKLISWSREKFWSIFEAQFRLDQNLLQIQPKKSLYIIFLKFWFPFEKWDINQWLIVAQFYCLICNLTSNNSLNLFFAVFVQQVSEPEQTGADDVSGGGGARGGGAAWPCTRRVQPQGHNRCDRQTIPGQRPQPRGWRLIFTIRF